MARQALVTMCRPPGRPRPPRSTDTRSTTTRTMPSRTGTPTTAPETEERTIPDPSPCPSQRATLHTTCFERQRQLTCLLDNPNATEKKKPSLCIFFFFLTLWLPIRAVCLRYPLPLNSLYRGPVCRWSSSAQVTSTPALFTSKWLARRRSSHKADVALAAKASCVSSGPSGRQKDPAQYAFQHTPPYDGQYSLHFTSLRFVYPSNSIDRDTCLILGASNPIRLQFTYFLSISHSTSSLALFYPLCIFFSP